MNRCSLLQFGASAVSLLATSRSASADPVAETQRATLKFELYRDKGRDFRWRLKAANGRILATSSEAYTAKADCRTAIDRIREGARVATIDDLSA
jgi:uncharacterized protein YegP (UPF0339 family)